MSVIKDMMMEEGRGGGGAAADNPAAMLVKMRSFTSNTTDLIAHESTFENSDGSNGITTSAVLPNTLWEQLQVLVTRVCCEQGADDYTDELMGHFRKQHIRSVQALEELTKDDFEALGVPIGLRRQLQTAARERGRQRSEKAPIDGSIQGSPRSLHTSPREPMTGAWTPENFAAPTEVRGGFGSGTSLLPEEQTSDKSDKATI